MAAAVFAAGPFVGGLAWSANEASEATSAEADEASGAPLGLLRSKKEAQEEDETVSDPNGDDVSIKALPTPPGTSATVDVGTLGGPSGAAIGLLGIQEGGFGDDMWLGSRRLVVENLLSEVPSMSSSPVVRELRRRLLLSKAYDPSGITAGQSILSLRVDRLYRSGLVDEALALSKSSAAVGGNAFGEVDPDKNLDPAVMKVAAQVYLLKDDIREACTQAVRVRSYSEEPFWSKLRAVCYAIAGDTEKAAFTAALLREESHQDDDFYGLIDHATENIPFALDGLTKGNALHWSLLKLIGEAFPPGSVSTSDLPVLARIAETGVAGGGPADLFSLRLPAAERAALYGAFPADALGALYRSAPIENAAGVADTAAFDQPSGEGLALRRAATFQAAEKTGDAVVRARLITQALSEAADTGSQTLAAELYAPLVSSLPADPILQARAKDILTLLILNGDYEGAARWFSLLERFDLTERRAGHGGVPQDVAGFRTLLALSHPFNSRTMTDWRSVARLTDATQNDDYEFAVLEVRLLDALGLFVPEEAKIIMLERPADLQGQMPQSGVLSGLDAAARAGRQAETVLYALVALGDAGPAGAHPSAVTKVVAGLTRVGLEREAKRVAIEALLARS